MSKWFLDLFLSNGRQRAGAFKKKRVSKSAFKHSYTVECGNCLRVCVLKTLACWGLRVELKKDKPYKSGIKRLQIGVCHLRSVTLSAALVNAATIDTPPEENCCQICQIETWEVFQVLFQGRSASGSAHNQKITGTFQ